MTLHSETPRIRYDEGCLAAHALNLIGDRWALLVVRELIFAPKRFQMLREGLPGVSASVLNGRLAQLRAAGIVLHDGRLGVYSLTGAGHSLLPVLESLCRWALLLPGHDPSRFISPSALMISMAVNLQRAASAGQEMTAGFDFGREAFRARLAGGRLQTQAMAPPPAAAPLAAPFTLGGTGNSLAIAVYGPLPLTALCASGTITLQGDADAAQRFVDLFSLTPQAD